MKNRILTGKKEQGKIKKIEQTDREKEIILFHSANVRLLIPESVT